MRQSSLTKLGSMINTAVNKRAGKSRGFVLLFRFIVFLENGADDKYSLDAAFPSRKLFFFFLAAVCKM